LPIEELLHRLQAGTDGLSSSEAKGRLDEYGPNELVRRAARPAWVSFLLLFTEPLILVLISAGVVSAFLGEPEGAIIIGLMVLGSVTLQFFQEYRSEQTAQKLARQVAITSTVVRDGVPVEVPIAELVPGDIIQLGVGDIVPADARVLSAKDFFLDQATLTGESLPVEKVPADTPGHVASLPDMTHSVFFGTNVVSGTATALVAETGARTQFGRLAKSLTVQRPETEFQRGIRRFTSLLVRVIGLLVVFIFILNTYLGRGILTSLLFAVAVSVGLTPELLPMIITVNLSAGAASMARHKVIVKRLQAIQNLGSMDTLCTDKTGTLTEGALALHECVDAAGRPSDRTFHLAAVNSLLQASLKSPMDAAIAKHDGANIGEYVKIDEVPFDFNRRRMSVIVEKAGIRTLITKGAPESVVSACDFIELDEKVQHMSEDLRVFAMDEFTRLSADGYRAVAVAYRQVHNERAVYSVADESGLTFVGYVSFIDPPKLSADDSVRELRELGVAVKILTGDNELVTEKICERVGLEVKGIVMGGDVDAMDDPELAQRAADATICARLSPEQKNRIINVLRAAGRVVGYMGDGINDTPSLRAADVGISVNNAVDVAKEAADIVLMEEGLHILEHGVIEGRRTFANTMKYIMMGTSSNFGNMFSVPAALFFVPFLPMRPVQILLNNFLYDFAQVTIPTDRVDEDYIAAPKQWNIDFIRNFMILFGPISSIYDILTYVVMLHGFRAAEPLFQTGWFLVSLATQTLVIHMIRTRHPFLESRPSSALLLSTIAVVGVGFAIPYTGIGRSFGFVPPPAPFFLFLVGVVAAYLIMVETVKRWFYRRSGS
jgi:Mg2+-importing ATPase